MIIDRLFDTYGQLVECVQDHVRATVPKQPGDSDFVYRQATRAKALDAVRGVLPAASLSNVGIYGSGQAFEALLLRMRSHPLPEATTYAELMLHELRKVIPSFLRRVDLPDRGGAWSDHLERTRTATAEVVVPALRRRGAREHARGHASSTGTPTPRTSCWPPSATPRPRCPSVRSKRRSAASPPTSGWPSSGPTWGERDNRRHKPGRAFERIDYRFDVLSDYGAFRDLQRHRLLTIEWQPLTPHHGYLRPELVDEAGGRDASTTPWRARPPPRRSGRAFPGAGGLRRGHGVPGALRHAVQRPRSMHLLELRSSPQGHPSYRRIVLEMHRLIAEQAGHRAVAAAMRISRRRPPPSSASTAERRAEVRRSAQPLT